MPCESPQCANKTFGNDTRAAQPRGFVRVVDNVAALVAVVDVKAAAFVDIGDKGSLDVLLNVERNSEPTTSIVTLFNNLAKFPSFVYLTSRQVVSLCVSVFFLKKNDKLTDQRSVLDERNQQWRVSVVVSNAATLR